MFFFYMIRSWRLPTIVTSYFSMYKSIILSKKLNSEKKLTVPLGLGLNLSNQQRCFSSVFSYGTFDTSSNATLPCICVRWWCVSV